MTRPRSIRFSRAAAIFTLGLLLAGEACAPRTPPVTTPKPAPAAPPVAAAPPAASPVAVQPAAPLTAVDSLRKSLDAVFNTSTFVRMQWAVLVQSLTTGEPLYSENPSKLMMPASNMKIVTLAAAAERLGWDFTYETRLVTSAPVVRGVLEGDLVVVGSGDPTIGGRGGPTNNAR